MSEIDLIDAILRNALELQRLSAHEAAEAEALLRELEAELRQMLNSRTMSEASKREIASLIKQAEKAIASRYTTIAGSLDTQGLVVLVSERTVEAMKLIAPDIAKVSAETLASLADDVLIDGAPSSAWWEKQAEDTTFKFAAQVRQGVINGETNEQIVARIVSRDGTGVLNVARRNARALVHSSVMAAANDARLATYRKNGRLIAGVRRLTALDGHVCVRCAAYGDEVDGWDLDGKPRGKTTLPFPPAQLHWNDRCVTSPIPKTFRDMGLDIDEPTDAGQRASSLGPISGSTSFADFFKRLSPAQQDAQFGKTRAAMFRAGKITIKDLVSGTGRELTLDELRRP